MIDAVRYARTHRVPLIEAWYRVKAIRAARARRGIPPDSPRPGS